MFVGTGSNVGKSILNTAFCRIFHHDGYNPAPFKAQNMSLNSFVTKKGLEIGRAQAVQAEAARVEPNEHMNPILLKPSGDKVSQIIIKGKPVGNKSAWEYFASNKDILFEKVKESFRILYSKYNPIVIEGAGSISELNLKSRDIVNMKIAKETNASVILVADIDRGGIFGSVYGTLELLEKEERKLIQGIIINKFRGDISLFKEGKKQLEKITNKKVIGIIPFFNDIYIDDEDSVSLKTTTSIFDSNKIKIAVVLLRHISNFTDFAPFEKIKTVHLYYAQTQKDIEDADIIIIPGSKNTISDIIHLKRLQLDKAIINSAKKDKMIIGICGGFQIMGKTILDPYGVESNCKEIPGLGILPIKTTLSKEKTTKQTGFYYKNYKNICSGYEIHMGITKADKEKPLNVLINGKTDGYILNEKCFGTYMHGIFDNETVLQDILNLFDKKSNISDFNSFKHRQYDLLAKLVRENTDIEYIYQNLRQ
jgi:adenosylcobyric acid synthase